MNFCVFSPDKCGMKVDQVEVKEQPGCVIRSQRLLANQKVVTEQIKVNERAKEITFRVIKNGELSDFEGVFALRSETLQLELHSRSAKSEMKLELKQPTSGAMDLFAAVKKACGDPDMLAISDCTAKLVVHTDMPKFSTASFGTATAPSKNQAGSLNSPKSGLPKFATA